MKITKRDGVTLEEFNTQKIKQAAIKAGAEENVAITVAQHIHYALLTRGGDRITSIYEIESLVVIELTKLGHPDIAKSYRDYAEYRRSLRHVPKYVTNVMEILENTNDEIASENSNKFAERLVTQRDLVAGTMSKHIYLNYMIPKHLRDAHESGLLHIHDTDYLAHRMFNCCLVDLESCINDYTVMNNVLVKEQTEFETACTVATQITAGVSANQLGGQTWSTLPLAKVLRKTREKLYKQFSYLPDEYLHKTVDIAISKALRSGVQTINYQLNTLGASANQSPFVTIFMYVAEDVEYENENLAIITEIIRQRRLGVENEDGHNISLSFPKLILVLEDRFFDGSTDKFRELITESAECVAKRLVPDFISEKVAKQDTGGYVVPPMGKLSA